VSRTEISKVKVGRIFNLDREFLLRRYGGDIVGESVEQRVMQQ